MEDGKDISRPRGQYFATQTASAEDLLKYETVGLVKLDDFRKRRAEVLERKERERQEGSGRATPVVAGGSITPADPAASPKSTFKKRRVVAKGKLSFGVEGDEDESGSISSPATSTINTPRSATPAGDITDGELVQSISVKRLGPNASLTHAPRVMTKSALAKEAQTRDQLRKDFLLMQEAVKATEILLPFCFYDGTNVPGGACRMKKGDHVWLFLDKARKLGAESGVGGGDKGRKEWARVGVDDLLLVRNEIIIPHHYDFYYFIADKTRGFSGPLFDFAATATVRTPAAQQVAASLPAYDPLSRPEKKDKGPKGLDVNLEGAQDDPTMTKVVDRRWYERNKHIFPASVWEEFDPQKDYTTGTRKDLEGNSFFFS